MARKYVNPNRPEIDRAVANVAARFSLDPEGDGAREVVARALAAELASGAGDDGDDLDAQAKAMGYVPPEARSYQPRAVVTREPRTYSPQSDPDGSQFLRDFVSQRVRLGAGADMGAETRLKRHMAEEQVERGKWLKRAGMTTGNAAGLVIPEYWTNLYGPAIQPLRPFADIANKHVLGETGITINLSGITTPDTAALQTTENVMPGTTGSPAVTMITEPVQTITGNVQLSRQLYSRGAGIDALICEDLMRAYASALDSQMINQAATGALALGAAQVQTFTQASPTPQLAWPWIAGAASAVETSLKGYAAPSHVVCTPQRMWWLASGIGATSMINTVSPAPQWSEGVMQPQNDFDKGPRYALPGGLVLVADGAIPTNVSGSQDTVLVVASREMHLFELPTQPLFIRADQMVAAQLGITLVVYGYMAFCLRRQPGALATVSGTGLVTPVF